MASTFIAEANSHPPHTAAIPDTSSGLSDGIRWEQDFADGTFKSESLQRQFGEMYHILSSLRQHHDLGPAIVWARWHSAILEARGSNLEFELHRLQFVCLFLGVTPLNGQSSFSGDDSNGPLKAWQYAKTHFAPFQARYGREIQQLLGALAFHQNLSDSPYRRTFHTDSAWEDVATSFTREFCSLLGLSADSPLYIAATAGAIALPTLVKLQNIMKEKRTEWTTVHELPVSALPSFVFFHHSLSSAQYNPSNTSFLGTYTSTSPPNLPLHFRLPRQQRASYRCKSAHDDALWPCHRQRVAGSDQQGRAVQMSVLSERE